ncbi:hypothetical protein RFI_26571, partial [Reticulomyxa filosa]
MAQKTAKEFLLIVKYDETEEKEQAGIIVHSHNLKINTESPKLALRLGFKLAAYSEQLNLLAAMRQLDYGDKHPGSEPTQSYIVEFLSTLSSKDLELKSKLTLSDSTFNEWAFKVQYMLFAGNLLLFITTDNLLYTWNVLNRAFE